MYEFGFPKEIISLTLMCMNGTRYQIRVDNTLSDEFDVLTRLKQGDTLSSILSHIVLVKVVRNVQKNNHGVKIDNILLRHSKIYRRYKHYKGE